MPKSFMKASYNRDIKQACHGSSSARALASAVNMLIL